MDLLNRPVCVVPNCGRWRQVLTNPKLNSAKKSERNFMKTCVRHGVNDIEKLTPSSLENHSVTNS
jgi:hypothetical protein